MENLEFILENILVDMMENVISPEQAGELIQNLFNTSTK